MRAGSTSIPRNAAPFMVAASGCAPPMPPMPPVTTQLARQSRRRNACRASSREGLERALHDALRADVDPRAGGHLAVHHQAQRFQPAEFVPVGPAPHQVGIGDQHARRLVVRAKHAHRLARLDQQRLVVFEPAQRRDDRVIALPVARGLAACRRRRPGPPAARPRPDPGCSSTCAAPLPAASPGTRARFLEAPGFQRRRASSE